MFSFVSLEIARKKLGEYKSLGVSKEIIKVLKAAIELKEMK